MYYPPHFTIEPIPKSIVSISYADLKSKAVRTSWTFLIGALASNTIQLTSLAIPTVDLTACENDRNIILKFGLCTRWSHHIVSKANKRIRKLKEKNKDSTHTN